MKYSQFNTIVPVEQKFAVYNSFSQKVIFIEPELKDILLAAVHEGIENLREFHPSFYKYLVEQEFVISESIDEISRVKDLSRKVDEDSKQFFLTINPTMNCNFKCWYCYETHIKQSRLDADIITRIGLLIDKITAQSDLEILNISFFGGEPLLYFKKIVVPIIEYSANVCHTRAKRCNISFTSNGYLINQEFVNFFNERDIKPALQITLDGYKEDHNKVRFVSATKGSYDEIIKNIRLLITNKFNVRLRINYTDKNINNTHKIANEFSDIPKDITDKYLLLDFHRVWQNHKIDETQSVVNKNIKSIRNNRLNVKDSISMNSVRDSCYADKRNSVVINYNGDIYKCTARDFVKANRVGYINEEGELIWENDHLHMRMNSKFKNKPCLTCRIMPLCNGGCSQHAMEHIKEDYCVLGGDESQKDEIVKVKIEEILRSIDTKKQQDSLLPNIIPLKYESHTIPK